MIYDKGREPLEKAKGIEESKVQEKRRLKARSQVSRAHASRDTSATIVASQLRMHSTLCGSWETEPLARKLVEFIAVTFRTGQLGSLPLTPVLRQSGRAHGRLS